MGTEKKKGIGKILLFGGVALIIVLMGAGGAYYYFFQSSDDSKNPLQSITETFTEVIDGITATVKDLFSFGGDEGPAGPGVRTHTVQEGENLWAIARKGKLVDNPWEWKTIVVQNRNKIEYTFISEDTGDWKVVMEPGQELRVNKVPFQPDSGPVKKKYALQLLSLPEKSLPKALKIVKSLLAENYAYLYRAEVKGKRVLRIRAGFYETKAQATKIGKRIQAINSKKNIYPGKFMVVVPSDRELRGEMLDFGVQQDKPWVVEFPQRSSHAKVLEDLKNVSPVSDFAYIAQKRNSPSGEFLYRIRIGFFTTKEQAKEYLTKQSGAESGDWQKAKVTRLESFKETLPGQRIKITRPPEFGKKAGGKTRKKAGGKSRK